MTAVEGEPRGVAISVIVPTHDRRRLLERKLRVLEEETVDFEVIVVADDCSDDTEAFLETYAPPYPLRWTTTPGRHVAYARNRGAHMATGRVLLFSDDDVIPRPGWLAAHLAAHEGRHVVGIGRLVLPPHLPHGATAGGVIRWFHATGAAVSLSAELFRSVGGYDVSFSRYGGEDVDLAYRLRRAGVRFESLPHAVAEHWDERYLDELEDKARAAGGAHVRVWRKHGDARIAWELGVHPVVLALKRLVLNGALAAVVRHPTFRYERAYLEGALAARREEEAPA
jgi:GT2 family glycosyltransferase